MRLFGMKENNVLEPTIVILGEPITATGLFVRTGMKSVFSDVTKILKKYMSYKDKYGIPNQKEPWEYVSLSTNFNGTQTWDYFTGHAVTNIENVPEIFIPFEIPSGTYAIFPIRPKYKFMLGLSIAKIKRYIYTTWILKSKYEFAGYEFEYNNEKLFKESPHFIDLYVGIKEKNEG
jgi:predicted transcriptional regulator YdeE